MLCAMLCTAAVKHIILNHIHLLIATQGISYLLVLGVIGWSIATKASTGSGLPAGPSGLLGAVEGVSYLSLLGGEQQQQQQQQCLSSVGLAPLLGPVACSSSSST